MMTFPIDKEGVYVDDIPEFGEIFMRYGQHVEDLRGMLAYLCFRFDPKSPVFANRSGGVDDRVRKAAELSGWEPPEPTMITDEFGKQKLDQRWVMFSEVTGEFFWALDHDDMEHILSLDIAIHNGHMVIREPIPVDMDAETKGKVIINIHKAIEGSVKAMEARKAKASEMANKDDEAAKAIMSSTKTRRASISPEGNTK